MQNKPTPRPIDAGQLCQLMEAVFAQGGDFRFRPTGGSMRPMLREQRDTVTLRSPKSRPPKRWDVVLYRRDNGRIVLHRIIGKKGDAFRLCGDRQSQPEEGVRQDQILGVLTEFCRGGRRISADAPGYRLYAVLWTGSRPVHRLLGKLKRAVFRQS